MATRIFAAFAALASLPAASGSSFKYIYGVWPGEDYLQDFWGPVRLGFEGSIAYQQSLLAVSDDDVAEIIGTIMGGTSTSACRIPKSIRSVTRRFLFFSPDRPSRRRSFEVRRSRSTSHCYRFAERTSRSAPFPSERFDRSFFEKSC